MVGHWHYYWPWEFYRPWYWILAFWRRSNRSGVGIAAGFRILGFEWDSKIGK